MKYWFDKEEKNQRFPPRHRVEPIPPGQSFEELTAKHGKPFGPFDQERILPYSGGKQP